MIVALLSIWDLQKRRLICCVDMQVSINGQSVDGKDLNEVKRQMLGREGSLVELGKIRSSATADVATGGDLC